MIKQIEQAINEVYGKDSARTSSLNITPCAAFQFMIPLLQNIAGQQGLRFWLVWGMNVLISGLQEYVARNCK